MIPEFTLSQYANSPVLMGVIDSFESAILPTDDIENFYNDIWNIDTATDYGLDCWGKIVGIGRYLEIILTEEFFGFADSGGVYDFLPWNQAPFYNSDNQLSTYRLGNNDYRKLIKAKALSNISQTDSFSLNAILRILFDGRRCYVVDNEDMTILYKFEFTLSAIERAIVKKKKYIASP